MIPHYFEAFPLYTYILTQCHTVAYISLQAKFHDLESDLIFFCQNCFLTY